MVSPNWSKLSTDPETLFSLNLHCSKVKALYIISQSKCHFYSKVIAIFYDSFDVIKEIIPMFDDSATI